MDIDKGSSITMCKMHTHTHTHTHTLTLRAVNHINDINTLRRFIQYVILPVGGRTVEADKLQTVLTKVDRQVSKFKGRMLKEKVGGGSEVRTQRHRTLHIFVAKKLYF